MQEQDRDAIRIPVLMAVNFMLSFPSTYGQVHILVRWSPRMFPIALSRRTRFYEHCALPRNPLGRRVISFESGPVADTRRPVVDFILPKVRGGLVQVLPTPQGVLQHIHDLVGRLVEGRRNF